MSSKNLAQRQSSKEPQYQPLSTSTAMDNPALTVHPSASGSTLGEMENRIGNIPSTDSSQELMPTPSRETRRSHWFTVSVLCFVNLINYMDRYTTAGVLSNIQDDFKIGDDDGGLLQTAFVLSYMVCAPIFGYLGDRYSRRWIMAIGVLLWSTTTLLGSFMTQFGWFITFRALVGIGEASYSTIAPTIISDLFINDKRSKMLAFFYFAIPVGSGFGYIVGSETARIAGDWRWALRVTPILGVIAVILILLIQDPERGESEGSHHMEATTYTEDIKDLMKNRSFMLSTAGFTCVAFVAGALSWWGPKFIYLGLRMQPGNESLTQNDVSYKFGIIAMIAGLIGVPLGSIMAQRLRPTRENCDPYICATGLFISAPMVYLALILPQTSATFCLLFVFIAQVSLNLCWSIVADILLYVVVPTRRSTAEAFQILISHALGDAGSPYLVGVLSEAIKKHLRNAAHSASDFGLNAMESLSLTLAQDVLPKLNETIEAVNSTIATTMSTTTTIGTTTTLQTPLAASLELDVLKGDDTNLVKFEALQYALFSTCFVEVLGGIFFFITAAFILKDKRKASQATREGSHQPVPNRPPVDIDEIS